MYFKGLKNPDYYDQNANSISPELNPDNILVFKNITKIINSKIANDNITIDIKENEIHALLGDANSGIKELISILCGYTKPTSGKIFLKQRKSRCDEIEINNPLTASRNGIAFVHKKPLLVEDNTALENIISGFETTKFLSFISYRSTRKFLAHIMDSYGIKIDVDMKVEKMNTTMKKRVEIIRALYRNCDIIVIDEPSYGLSEKAVEEISFMLNALKSEGKTVIYLTSSISEAKKYSDRVTLISKGKKIGTYESKYMEEDLLTNLLYQTDMNYTYTKGPFNPRSAVLELLNVRIEDETNQKVLLEDFNLLVRKGEIVSICGPLGCGQDEIVKAILGLTKVKSGEIIISGQEVTNMSMKKRKISQVFSISDKYSFIPDYSLKRNLVFGHVNERKFSTFFLNNKNISKNAHHILSDLHLELPNGVNTKAFELDDDTLQKLVVERELASKNDLIILVKPTQNVNIFTAREIRNEILHARDKKKAILLISYDLDEIYALSDTIYTLSRGWVTGIFPSGGIPRRELGLYQEGIKAQPQYEYNRPSSQHQMNYSQYNNSGVY